MDIQYYSLYLDILKDATNMNLLKPTHNIRAAKDHSTKHLQ